MCLRAGPSKATLRSLDLTHTQQGTKEMFNHRNTVIFIILVVFMALMKWKGKRRKTMKLAGNYLPTYLRSTKVGPKNKGIT